MARPGTVIATATTHVPLARQDLDRVQRLTAPGRGLAPVTVGTPPFVVRRAASAGTPAARASDPPTVADATVARLLPRAGGLSGAGHDATGAGAPAGGGASITRLPVAPAAVAVPGAVRPPSDPPTAPSGRATAAPASPARDRGGNRRETAAVVRAAERASARVTVRRLPAGAAGTPLVGRRRSGTTVAGALSFTSASASLAPRTAALGADAVSDLARRAPVAAPVAVVGERRPNRSSAAEPGAGGPRPSVVAAARRHRTSASGPHTLAVSAGGAHADRRPPLLPNARRAAGPGGDDGLMPQPSMAHGALVRRSSLLPTAPASRRAEIGPSTPSGAAPAATTFARGVAAFETAGLDVRRQPVGTPAALVAARTGQRPPTTTESGAQRRSLSLPTAPASAASTVLPSARGPRTRGRPRAMSTAHPLTAERATGAGATTAERLRELVATGAFDGGPVLRRTAADRFHDVIRRSPTVDRPASLPQRFRPLADRIVGPGVAIQVVHGAVTRRALAAAGHEAATTDRTIHLPTRPDASATTMSVVAHELEHVAAPSPVARFHGGPASPEEARAMRTEQVVRRLARDIDRRGGPGHPGTAGLPVAAMPAFGRSGTGAPSGGRGDVQRSARPPAPTTGSTRAARPTAGASTTGGGDRIHRAPTDAIVVQPTGESGSPETSDSGGSAALSSAQLSAIIRAVEDRLVEEIERRGGLRRGAF
ncbi:MAG TPA: DUF4157 domain-containing protein [Acidimicrobiales bacterium]|nr:DUF4157 domain-containing protein [Acidimicrobiales bacterium]